MKPLKNILLWTLVAFMALVALAFFPSIASIIAIIFTVIAAPIKPLQEFFANRGLRGFAKGAILCAAFIGTMATVPARPASTSDNTTRGTLPSAAVTQKAANPGKSAGPAQSPESSTKPTPTPEPTATATPTPEPTPAPTPEPTPEPEPEPTPTPAPTPAPQPIRGRSPDTIVYVSNRSNTIHSVHNCSGMRNYREMTISNAVSRGYDFCTNCW